MAHQKIIPLVFFRQFTVFRLQKIVSLKIFMQCRREMTRERSKIKPQTCLRRLDVATVEMTQSQYANIHIYAGKQNLTD